MSNWKLKIEIFKGKDGQFYNRFKSRNGQIVSQSEGYKRKRSCLANIDLIKGEASNSEVVDLS